MPHAIAKPAPLARPSAFRWSALAYAACVELLLIAALLVFGALHQPEVPPPITVVIDPPRDFHAPVPPSAPQRLERPPVPVERQPVPFHPQPLPPRQRVVEHFDQPPPREYVPVATVPLAVAPVAVVTAPPPAQVRPVETTPPVNVPPPPPPVEAAPAPIDPAVIAAYNAKLNAAVQAAFRVPQTANDMGFKGRVRIEFSMRDGIVANPRVVVPSGLGLVDRAALKAVESARYPLPPSVLVGKDGTYTIWVECR